MAGTVLKGLTIEINGNTTPLQKALAGLNNNSRDLQQELKQIDTLLKLDPTNTDLMARKMEVMAKQTDNTKEKINALTTAQDSLNKQFAEGAITEDTYTKQNAELEKQLKKVNSSLEVEEAQLKQTSTEIKKAEANTENLEKKSERMSNTMKRVGDILKATAVTIGAGVVALGAMANKAIEDSDELQRLSDVTGMTAETLQEFKYIGANLGVELETITGAQTKLIKSMSAAQDGSKAQAEAFKDLGVKVTNSKGQLLDSQEVMGDVFDALSKIENPTKRDALAMQILGKSARDLNPLINAGADGLKKLSEDAKNNGAIMSNEAVAGLDAFGDNLDNLKNSVMGAFGESLSQLLPKIQEILAKIDLEKLKQNIKEFAEKTMEVFNFIIENGATITALIVGIGAGMVAWNVATMIQGVVGAIKAFATANDIATVSQWALNAAQSASGIGIIVALIAGLVVAIVALWNTNEGFRNAVTGAWEAVKNSFAFMWEKLKEGFANLIQWFIDIPNKVTEMKDNIIKYFNELPYNIGLAIGQMIQHIIDFGVKFTNWVVTELPKIIINFLEWYISLPGKILTAILGIITKMGEWAKLMITWIATNLPTIITNIVDFFLALPGKIFNIGVDMVKGLWDGIQSMVGWIGKKIGDFVKGIKDGFTGKQALDVNSPSKWAMGVGEGVSEGLSIGIDKKALLVNKSFKDVFSTLNNVNPNLATQQNANNNNQTIVNNYNVKTIGDTTAEFIQKTRAVDKSKSMLGGAVFA